MDAKQRVVTERTEVDQKHQQLCNFIQSVAFGNLSRVSQGLLLIQANTMAAYVTILTLRLENWGDS